jgi:hypothetical protein
VVERDTLLPRPPQSFALALGYSWIIDPTHCLGWRAAFASGAALPSTPKAMKGAGLEIDTQGAVGAAAIASGARHPLLNGTARIRRDTDIDQ